MSYDVLFIHAPNLSNFYLPSGRFINNNYIPVGQIALANMVREAHYQTLLLHLGVERLLDENFSVVEFVRNHDVKMVGLDLFWFHQSYDVIDVARKIKRQCPSVFLFLGGLTASYYAEEILEEFPFIDAISCGYGETNMIPLVHYAIDHCGSIEKISNLYYRKNNHVVCNEKGVVCPDIMNTLNYSALDIIHHYSAYVDYFGLHEMPLDSSKCRKKIMNESIYTKMFPLAIGRGCDSSCIYCGGNAGTCKKLYGQQYMIWREIENVVNDIQVVKQYGYNKVFICFDPLDHNDNYYERLFEEIKKRGIQISMYFECWKLPSISFIKAFSNAFPDKNSHLLISVDSVSETIRQSTRGNQFTNMELEAALTQLDNYHVRYDLCFSLGLPNSTLRTDLSTYDYMRFALQSHRMIGRVITFLIDIVPGSLIYEYPERYDAQVNVRSFMDYYHSFENPLHSTYAMCEYKLNHYFGDERDNGSITDFSNNLQYIKCKYFCGINEEYKLQQGFEENSKKCARARQTVFDDLGVDITALPFNDQYQYQDELALFVEKYDAERSKYS